MNDIYQAPQSELTDTLPTGEYGSVDKAIHGDYSMEIGTVLSESWGRVPGSKWTFHLAFGIYFLVCLALLFVISGLFYALGLHAVPADLQDMPLVIQLMGGGGIIESLLYTVATMPAWAGITILGIRRAVGAPLHAMDILSYYRQIVPLSVTFVIMYVLMMIGFLLLVIPGIYLAVAWSMALPLVIDKKMSPWQALETSRKAVTKHWFSLFGLYVVLSLINVMAIIPLGIGLIWTLPLFCIAIGVAYRNMFGCEEATKGV